MHQCHACPGFIPNAHTNCPQCGSGFKPSLMQRFRRVMQILLGASVTMTLAACYGIAPPMPLPCDDKEDGQKPCPPSPPGSPSPNGSPSPSSTPSSSPSAS